MDSSKEFQIHKSFLCFYSPYFKAALNSPFTEGKNQAVDLDEMCPVAFSMFINWVYTQRIERSDKLDITMNNCIELWILAERLLIPKLQNEVMLLIATDKFYYLSTFCYGENNLFHRIYENTTEDILLRRCIVARFTARDDRNFTVQDDLPQEMLLDMGNLARPQLQPHNGVTEEEARKYYFVEEE